MKRLKKRRLIWRRIQTPVAVWIITAWATSVVYADNDFEPKSAAWNGLSDFISLVGESNDKVEIPERIDVGKLSSDDALLIIHPTRELPVVGLTQFLKDGGRVAIVDDNGTSEKFLNTFEFGRFTPVVTKQTAYLRGNKNLLIAKPVGGHPLTEDVLALVTNHPKAIHHNGLKPVFSFNVDQRSGLVLVGAIHNGRLIVVADSSVLINNMLEFRGNRAFARNLIRYLTNDNERPLHIAIQATEIVSTDSSVFAPRDSLDGIRKVLALVSRLELPPSVVYALTIIIAAMMFLIAIAALLRRPNYNATPDMFVRYATVDGVLGNVWLFSQKNRNLLQPLLVFKAELEAAIQKKFGLIEKPQTRDLREKMRELRMPEREIDELHRLLGELEELQSRRELSRTAPRISIRRFRDAVDRGIHILERLETTR
jgi:hypothetical protein